MLIWSAGNHSILKDTPILIPVLSLNRSKKLWGEDASEFKCVVPPFVPSIPLRVSFPQARTLGEPA